VRLGSCWHITRGSSKPVAFSQQPRIAPDQASALVLVGPVRVIRMNATNVEIIAENGGLAKVDYRQSILACIYPLRDDDSDCVVRFIDRNNRE
jgi:hypothetical protein